jgi:hypothetical protein
MGMKLSPISQRVHKKVCLIFTSGIILPLLSGCDPTVQTAVLGGFEELANALIGAVFLQLQPEETTTVTAQLITQVATMLG